MAKVHIKPQYVFGSLNDKIQFGRYKGRTVGDLLDEAPDYIKWLYDENIAVFPEEIIRDAEDYAEEMHGNYDEADLGWIR